MESDMLQNFNDNRNIMRKSGCIMGIRVNQDLS